MTSFRSARFKLTVWYVSFVMLLSVAFSFGVYQFLTMELDRSLQTQAIRLFTRHNIIVPPEQIADIYNEAHQRITLNLLLLNVGIFLVSTCGSYFLAGKTLRPLELVAEEQKRFIADASHELKTPLTSMKTEIEVAIRDKKLTLSDAKKLIQSNLEEVEKMRTLTNYLLSLSRYENTKPDLIFEEITMQEMYRSVIKKIDVQARLKNITVEEKGGNFMFRSIKVHIEELIVILLDNAVKYSLPGSTVTLFSQKNKKDIIISVEDTGFGIATSDIPHIFDRFYRADFSRTKQNVEGYGLGLSIAKKIVEELHGHIDVKSRLGKGSLFTVTLPNVG